MPCYWEGMALWGNNPLLVVTFPKQFAAFNEKMIRIGSTLGCMVGEL